MTITIRSEDDLWQLFSESPDAAGSVCLRYDDLRAALDPKAFNGKPLKLTDTTRYYHLFDSTQVTDPSNTLLRATVTQANLRRVAAAMARCTKLPGGSLAKTIFVMYLGNRA